jgi:dynein heavy chain
MHSQQVEAKKSVLSAVSQVDDMYDMLAAYEQKVRSVLHCCCA